MNKIDIFNANAEFFERFNNSLEDTTKDRYERTRFTVTGLENKVEFAVTNAQGRIKKAEDDAVDRLNKVNGMTNDELISKSVGVGKWLREKSAKLDYMRDTGTYYSTAPTTPFERGAYGTLTKRYLEEGADGIVFEGSKTDFVHFDIQSAFGSTADELLTVRDLRGFNAYCSYRRDTGSKWNGLALFYNSKNTRTDKNNVLHSGTGTPINTLNVSDMADTVVNREDMTVTSGAVYRAIQELKAEIALLKGKSYE